VCPVITATCFWNMDTIEIWYSETGGFHIVHQRRILGILWYEFVTNEEVATLSQLLTINEGISWRTLSLWPRQVHGSGCSCPPDPTPLSHHDRAQDSLAPGEDNHAVRENVRWSMWPWAQGSLCLTPEVLQRIRRHGGRYDPSTVKRREKDRERAVMNVSL